MACFSFSDEAQDRILIESHTEVADAVGGQTTVYSEQSTVWSVVSPLSDFQRNQSQQLQSMVTHKFIIRYQTALADVKTTAKHRITLDGRLYDIVGIKNVDDDLKRYGKTYQIIMANENGADV